MSPRGDPGARPRGATGATTGAATGAAASTPSSRSPSASDRIASKAAPAWASPSMGIAQSVNLSRNSASDIGLVGPRPKRVEAVSSSTRPSFITTQTRPR